MIADDDSALQPGIRLTLEPAGHTIFVAGDGRTGLMPGGNPAPSEK